jgi:hypothetical protein
LGGNKNIQAPPLSPSYLRANPPQIKTTSLYRIFSTTTILNGVINCFCEKNVLQLLVIYGFTAKENVNAAEDAYKTVWYQLFTDSPQTKLFTRSAMLLMARTLNCSKTN